MKFVYELTDWNHLCWLMNMKDANPPPARVLYSIDQIQFAVLYIFPHSHINHMIPGATSHDSRWKTQFRSISERIHNQPLTENILLPLYPHYYLPLPNKIPISAIFWVQGWIDSTSGEQVGFLAPKFEQMKLKSNSSRNRTGKLSRWRTQSGMNQEERQ